MQHLIVSSSLLMRLDLLLVLALAAIVPSAGYRFFRAGGLHATRPVHIRRSRAQRAEYPSSVLLAVKENTYLSPIVSSNDPFWYQGLNFSCTGCGRCCQNEGEVWLNTEEFYQVSNHLGLSYTDFIDFYVETVRSGWVMLKSNKAPATQRISPSISTPSAVGSESSLSDSKTIEASQPGGIQKIENEQCIFLAEDGKQCTIYNVRPTQCRTYPYWPSLLSSRANWLEERVLPESIDIEPPTNEAKEAIVEGGIGGDGRNGGSGGLQRAVDKYWSVEDGGCEGIEHFESSMLVDRNTIHRNCMQYTMYHDEFPFMTAGEDASRLLAKAGAIERVNRATQAWVQDFVIGYNLCPFAESVFSAGQVRYKVYLGSRSEEDIIERIKYEVYALLNAKPEDAETTLLMLPFAFPTFEEFYDFSVRMEDIYLPQIERETRIVLSSNSDSSSGSGSSNAVGSRRSLKDVLSKKQASGETKGASDGSSSISSEDSEPEIKLAFFHPGFRWADVSDDEEGEGQLEGEEGDREEEGNELDSVPASAFGSASGLLSIAAGGSAFNRPLNFEKRAPFPTINLLRAKTIRDFANQRKTSAIALGNRSALEEAGSEQLVADFNRIMQLAIDG